VGQQKGRGVGGYRRARSRLPPRRHAADALLLDREPAPEVAVSNVPESLKPL
jgi:hypothetical protein